MNGKGILTTENGEKYEGEWKNGQTVNMWKLNGENSA